MRLIDADEFIKEINNRCESAIKWGINAIADHNDEIKVRAEQTIATFCEASLMAKKMPTIDAEPIVRCKDCKHFDGSYPMCCRFEETIEPDGYCSFGEKTEVEE